MLKKLFFSTAIAFSLVMGGTAAQAAQGFKDLSFDGTYLPRHPTALNVFLPFIKRAEEKFPGKNGLSFHYFSRGELVPDAESIAALADGRVDFGTVAPAMFPGQMSLLNVVAIPGMCPNAIVGSLVTQELIEQFPEVRAQLPGNSVPFTSWASASYQVHTREPVRSPEELKGKKLIVWNATSLAMVKAMGGNPIRLSTPDTYLALSRGMADGVFCPLAPVRAYKINEICKNHYILSLGVDTFIINANKAVWDSMPQDMRDWLKAEGGMKMALDAGRSLEDGVIRDTKWMRDENGEQFYVPSDEERAAALKPLATFADAWKEECKGEDPALLDKILTFARERSAFHTAKMHTGEYGEAYKR